MHHLQPGDRVELVRCTDPYTDLAPGALGTVSIVSEGKAFPATIHIRWDNGSTLSMIPEAGDVVRKLAKPEDESDDKSEWVCQREDCSNPVFTLGELARGVHEGIAPDFCGEHDKHI